MTIPALSVIYIAYFGVVWNIKKAHYRNIKILSRKLISLAVLGETAQPRDIR